MKKLIQVIFLSTVIANQSKAQFPYASIWSDFTPTYTLTSGFATTATPGFLWCGYQPVVNPGGFPWWPNNMNFFIRGYGASSIWPAYKIYGTNSSSCSGPLTQVLNGVGVTCIEVLNSSIGAYAIAGAYDNGVFFTMLSSSGIPVNKTIYPFPKATAGNPAPTRPLLAQEPLSGDFLISGSFEGELFVLRVSASGSLIWSSFYSIPGSGTLNPKDLVIDPRNTSDLVIVGSAVHNGSDLNGFLTHVDVNTGLATNTRIYGNVNRADEFNTIIAASNVSSTNGQGYVIAGSTELTANTKEAWILKTDLSGSIIWSSVSQPASGTNTGFVDVIERLNTFGNYEYYGVVRSSAGMVVLKMDDSGRPFPYSAAALNNEFIYNLPGTAPSVPAAISQVAGPLNGPDVGIQVYGTANNISSAATSHFVSAYFNGETNCLRSFQQQSPELPGPTRNLSVPVSQHGGFNSCSNFLISVVFPGGAMNFPCSGYVTTGNSAKPSVTTGIENQDLSDIPSGVYPNPFNGKTTLKYSAQQNETVNIQITNLLGEQVKSDSFVAAGSGDCSQELDFESMQVKAGVYLVTSTINGRSETHKVIYTR